MKKNIIFIGTALLALLSCSKIENPSVDPQATGDGKFEVTFNCSMADDDTKTEFNEDKTIWWSVGDKILYAQFATVEGEQVFTSTTYTRTTARKAFTITISGYKTPDPGTESEAAYYSVYPYSAYQAHLTTSNGYPRITLNDVQKPTATNFDPDADILVSELVTGLEPNEENKYSVTLRYARPSAIGKMKITGLPSGSNIKNVSFSATKGGEPVNLAGSHFYDLTTGKISADIVTSSCYDNQSLTLDYSDLASPIPTDSEDFTAYFCCYPFLLEEGDTFFVTVTTDSDELFLKRFTVPTGRTLALEAGKGTKFTANMTGTVPASVIAITEDSYIGYSTLEDAFSAVDGNTATIRLLKDCTLGASEVKVNDTSSDITLDLAGKTVTENADGRLKVGKGKLTVMDSDSGGKILMPSGSAQTAVWLGGASAEFVLESGAIVCEGSSSAITDNIGTLTVNGGSVLAEELYAIYAYYTSAVTENIVINGGEFTSKAKATLYCNNANASVTINGGSFKNECSTDSQTDGRVVFANNGTVVINGGYFYTCTTYAAPRCFYKGTATMTIFEAYFNSQLASGYRDAGSSYSSASEKHTHNGVELTYTYKVTK